MLTNDQVISIREEKDHKSVPTSYMFVFEEEWNKAVKLLVNSKADLSKIKLVEKKGK